jgi:hypothetical protein
MQMGTSQFIFEARTESERIDETAESNPSFAENRYSKFLFQRESILKNAPESPGVYGLFSAFWIYIGEAENVRARLLQHLDGDDPCIVRYRPSGFAFELTSPAERLRRREQLMKQLQPLCSGEASHDGKVHQPLSANRFEQ